MTVVFNIWRVILVILLIPLHIYVIKFVLCCHVDGNIVNCSVFELFRSVFTGKQKATVWAYIH